jgi:hypothetical protein
LVVEYPPIVKGRSLTYSYIHCFLNFFEKLVVWHEIFVSASHTTESTSTANLEFLIIRYLKDLNPTLNIEEGSTLKPYRDQMIKLTSFNQPMLLELLTTNVHRFCCFQNHGYS